MARRTGTQLKGDMTAAETALDAAVATPTDANINAAVAALATVRTNARESSVVATRGSQQLSQDVRSLARAAQRELRTVQAKGGTDTEKSHGLSDIRAELGRGLWASTKDKTTTD